MAAVATEGSPFAAVVHDMNTHLFAANEANRARRQELLAHLTGGGVLGHFTDVSPLLRGPSSAGAYADPTAYFLGGGGGRGLPTLPMAPPPMLTTSEAVDRQVQEAVSKALRGHEDRVAEIVARDWDRRSQELEHALRSRFTDLQVLNESTGRLLRDVGNTVATLKSDIASNSERHDAALANLAAELRTRIADVARSTNREVMSLRETVLELQSRFAVDTAEYSRRIDASQRRATEAYADVLAVVEQRTAQVRTDLENTNREATRKMQTEIDAALRLAQDSHAIVARGDAELRRLGAKAAEAHEDAAIRRSELRTLHADVQQLELYMKGRIDKIAAATSRGAAGGGGHHRGADTVGSIELDRLQRDVFALQQGLTFVSNKLRAYGFLDEDDDDLDQVPPPAQSAAQQNASYRQGGGLGDSVLHSSRRDAAQPLVVSDLTSQPGSTRKPSQFTESRLRQNSTDVSPRSVRMDISAGAAKAKRRYSRTADPFLHSAQSFEADPDYDNGAEDDVDDRASDDSNRRLANSQID